MLRRWLPLLAVAALLAAALMAAVFAEPQLDVAVLPQPSPSGQAADGSADPSASASAPEGAQRVFPVVLELPGWVDSAVSVVCLVAIVVVVVLLLWYVVRDTAQARGRPIAVDAGPTHAPVPHAAEVAAALEAGIAGLSDVDTDARHAVIACWVRLEQAAADAGTPRRVSDAPAEYVLRLLSAHRVSRPVLDRFAAVYRWARYGSAPVDESMRATAVSALRQLRDELTVEAAP